MLNRHDECCERLEWTCSSTSSSHKTDFKLVSFPDPFWKNQEGVWQHVLHCRVRAHCTVHANQVAEFSYIMLIKNVQLWHLLTMLVLLILTRLLMLPVREWGTKGCIRVFTDRLRKELLLWLPSHRLRLFEGSNLLDCHCCHGLLPQCHTLGTELTLLHDRMAHTQVLHTAGWPHIELPLTCVNINT